MCELTVVEPVVWNGCNPVTIEVRLQPVTPYKSVVIRLEPSHTGSYVHADPLAHPETKIDREASGSVNILIQSLDRYRPDSTSSNQPDLGAIDLSFMLVSAEWPGGARRKINKRVTVELPIKSPFAHPLADPHTVHAPPTDGSYGRDRLPRSDTARELLQQIAKQADDKPIIIWFHGPPGCGKTSLLRDVRALAPHGYVEVEREKWYPVHVRLKVDPQHSLASNWAFMYEIDKCLSCLITPLRASFEPSPGPYASLASTTPEQLDWSSEHVRTEYEQDPYLQSFSVRLKNALHERLKDGNDKRILLMLDGFYYLKEAGPELYRHLLRQAYLLSGEGCSQYILLITDVVPFDQRVNQLREEHPILARDFDRLIKRQVVDQRFPWFTENEIAAYVEILFSKAQHSRFPSLARRLRNLTCGHSTLLLGILQQTAYLYELDAGEAGLALSRSLAQALADRYEHLGVVSAAERQVWRIALDGKNPKKELAGCLTHRQVEDILKELRNKDLIQDSGSASWIAR